MPDRIPRSPKYRLHKPSRQAVVTIGGRDHYLGRHGSEASFAAFDRLIGEWLACGRPSAIHWTAGVVTVTEVAAAYWNHAQEFYQKHGVPTGELGKIKTALKAVRRLHGRTECTKFGPLALKTVRDAFIKTGIGRRSVNDQVGRLKRMFRWAVETELVPPSVYHGLQAVAGLRQGHTTAPERTLVQPVADEFVDAVRPYVAKQVWSMVELQRLTGMRSGEVLIMRSYDLDMSGPLWLYSPSSHKTEHFGHQRTVELGPKAQEVIRPFLKHDLQAYLFSPAQAVAEWTVDKRRRRQSRVQPSQRNRTKPNPKRKPADRYTTDSYRRAIQRGCVKAWPVPTEIEHDAENAKAWCNAHSWHPHQLRHSYATRIRKEYGVEAARILLGHRSAVVTELYAEVDRGRVRDIVAKVG